MVLRAASQSGSRYPRRASDPLAVGGCHERALASLLVGTVGGALVGVLVPLRFAFEAVKNHPDRLLAQGMAGGNVEELLGGSRALMS